MSCDSLKVDPSISSRMSSLLESPVTVSAIIIIIIHEGLMQLSWLSDSLVQANLLLW